MTDPKDWTPRIETCTSQLKGHVFSHYAFGDPMPQYAIYLDSDGEAEWHGVPAAVYRTCAREGGHPGKHISTDGHKWSDEQAV